MCKDTASGTIWDKDYPWARKLEFPNPIFQGATKKVDFFKDNMGRIQGFSNNIFYFNYFKDHLRQTSRFL